MIREFIPMLVVSMVLITGCRKDGQEAPIQPSAPLPPAHPYSISDFFQHSPGSYWVFERYRYDSNGVYLSGPLLDSFFVSSDTLISGISYAVFKRGSPSTGTSYVWQCLRDSADCVVSSGGQINFRFGAFDQVAWSELQPGILYMEHTVHSAPLLHAVPAGSFLTYLITSRLEILFAGLPPVPASRFPYAYWSPGVGRVMHMQSYATSGMIEISRLLRYQIT
jgi:hypothetical protein